MKANIMNTSWNLSLLFKSDNDPEIKRARAIVEKESYKFINKWSKRSDYLRSPKILKTALDEYEKWAKYYGAGEMELYYFYLRSSLNQNDAKLKAKLNKIQDFSKKIQNDIQFFELKIAKIDIKNQKKLLNYKPLLPYKHFLEKLFEVAKHTLTEPEEKIMNLKSATSHTNWVRMLSSFLAKEERKVFDEKGKKKVKNFPELMGLMNSKSKKTRDVAAKAFNEILQKYTDVAENELNSVLQNKKVNDELRKYKRADSARHMADDIQTDVVESLVDSVSKKFDITKEYYKLKADLLKVPKLKYHERNVEYGKTYKKYSFKEGTTLIEKVLTEMDKELLDIYLKFLKEGRVDVYPKKGKKDGAYAIHNLITQPTYLLLNWTDRLNDVRTFAHEAGHGIHYELVRKKQNAINFDNPVSTAEVASTFFEDFVIQELLKNANDELKLSLMMSKLNQDVSSIFRQIAFYNFETELHNKFREKGYLSEKEIGKIFQKHMKSYMGNYVEQSEGSENWWVYVDHFRLFFYVYSYSSGLLISKSLQASFKKNPKFIGKIKEFLSAGTSDSPKNILKKLGIDIADKKFWEKGLAEVDNLLKETEKLAKKLNKIK